MNPISAQGLSPADNLAALHKVLPGILLKVTLLFAEDLLAEVF